MIKIEKAQVLGWEAAIRGTRNPLNSWDRSDSKYVITDEETYPQTVRYEIGSNDLALMKRLSEAGPDHGKFLRMIVVYMDVTAPMYWWAEFDTYKVGTVRNSCSKMHKLLEKPFEASDFSFDKLPGYKNKTKQYKPDVDASSEIWVTIEKNYEVSNKGRIRNTKNGTILNCSLHSDGYLYVTIGGMQKPLHRIIAEAFCNGYSKEKVVNHKDGNKQNNSADNLEWITQKENIKHSLQSGLQGKPTKTYLGKFSQEQREKIRKMYSEGSMSLREIAMELGVSHTCINDILKEKYKYCERRNLYEEIANPVVDLLNELRDKYFECQDDSEKKRIWYSILQILPGSYNQKATIMLNYAVLRNIYNARKNHKLEEWHIFCDWIRTLPYAEELITGSKSSQEGIS